jgi:para-nitrobenzyl esterase
MRVVVCLTALLASITCTAALAQANSSGSQPAAAATAKAPYNSGDTDIGTLLDDPAARAIVDKHIPGFSAGEQVDMARGMTLKSIQQFAPDKITDQVLADIDNELAKLAANPKK